MESISLNTPEGFPNCSRKTRSYSNAPAGNPVFISLKYNLPESLLSKARMSDLALKVQLLNPLLFTEAVNTDPDMGNNPIKSVVIGINVGF